MSNSSTKDFFDIVKAHEEEVKLLKNRINELEKELLSANSNAKAAIVLLKDFKMKRNRLQELVDLADKLFVEIPYASREGKYRMQWQKAKLPKNNGDFNG